MAFNWLVSGPAGKVQWFISDGAKQISNKQCLWKWNPNKTPNINTICFKLVWNFHLWLYFLMHPLFRKFNWFIYPRELLLSSCLSLYFCTFTFKYIAIWEMIFICLFFNMVNGKKSARNKLLGSAISSHEEFLCIFMH